MERKELCNIVVDIDDIEDNSSKYDCSFLKQDDVEDFLEEIYKELVSIKEELNRPLANLYDIDSMLSDLIDKTS
jgi:hypothetical protein